MAFTPAARLVAHSRSLSAAHAKCAATREEEQAVSVDTQGPVKPHV